MKQNTALIIGASGGIGAAVADALGAQGTEVTRLSRKDGLDVTDEAAIERALGAQAGPFDLIFVATGGLEIDGYAPEKTLRALSAKGLTDQFQLNAMGPALILKHSIRLLPRKAPSTFAVLSARVGSIGDNRLGGWYAYRAAKAALNQLIHGAAIELRRSHPQAVAVCLHPGTVATRFTQSYPAHKKVTPAEAAQNLLAVLGRLTPDQSGGFFDYAGKEIPW